MLFSGVDLTQAEILLRSWDLPTPVCDLGLRQVVVVVATCCFDFLRVPGQRQANCSPGSATIRTHATYIGT